MRLILSFRNMENLHIYFYNFKSDGGGFQMKHLEAFRIVDS